MNSVMRTNPLKMAMLTAGSPIVALSAAKTSATADSLGVGAARAGVVVVLEALAHLVGDRVGALVGVVHVQVRDHEGGHELAEAEQESESHVAEDLGRHEVVRVGREEDVEQVPGEERGRHREGEGAEPLLEVLELGGVLGGQILLRRQQSSFVRIRHDALPKSWTAWWATPRTACRDVAAVTVGATDQYPRSGARIGIEAPPDRRNGWSGDDEEGTPTPIHAAVGSAGDRAAEGSTGRRPAERPARAGAGPA